MTPGQHFIHACLALVLAMRLASGWGVLPATLSLWVVLLLLAGLVDALFQRRFGPPQVPAVDVHPPTAAPAPVFRLEPLPRLPPRADAVRHTAPAGREWRRHAADIDVYCNERYPAGTGFCAIYELFLREGDALLLRFHPDAQAGRAHAHWRCDLWRQEEEGRRAEESKQIDVGSGAEARIRIERTGVYALGVGQGIDPSTSEGRIGVWVAVPSADALSPSLKPATISGCRYARTADGDLVVRIEHECAWQTHARLPQREIHRVPQGALLLFANTTDAWDASGIADPASDWQSSFRHLHRWYFQLSRGDVLVLERAWQAGLFGQRLPDEDGFVGFTNRDLHLYKFVRGPHLSYRDSSTDGRQVITCDADGFYCLELALHGPPPWRGRPSTDFVDLRLWGAFLQRPQALRDFDLREGRVEDRYRMLMPVPRGLA
ncbi:hypothetical protein [Pseudorhodoferax sp.]|uniref:hypothetical protein n=1 Tax=Pseudorhodoferax sp. TaxID=1993553 RepID=UPI0039E499E1